MFPPKKNGHFTKIPFSFLISRSNILPIVLNFVFDSYRHIFWNSVRNLLSSFEAESLSMNLGTPLCLYDLENPSENALFDTSKK